MNMDGMLLEGATVRRFLGTSILKLQPCEATHSQGGYHYSGDFLLHCCLRHVRQESDQIASPGKIASGLPTR